MNVPGRLGSAATAYVLLPLSLLALCEGAVRWLAPGDLVLCRASKHLLERRDGRPPYVNRAGFAGRVCGHHVEINAHHLRGPALDDGGKRRLLLLGDSVLFGMGLADRETAAVRLAALLADSLLVLNAGTIGYATRDEGAFLEAFGDALRPDAVLLAYCLNDPYPGDPFQYGMGGAVFEYPVLLRQVDRWLGARSKFWKWLRGSTAFERQLARGFEVASVLYHGAAWEQTGRDLRAMQQWSEARGVPLLLAVFPFRYQYVAAEAARMPQQKLMRFAAENDIPALDLFPILDFTDYLFGDGVHLNAHGMDKSLQAIAAFYAAQAGRPVSRPGAILPHQAQDPFP